MHLSEPVLFVLSVSETAQGRLGQAEFVQVVACCGGRDLVQGITLLKANHAPLVGSEQLLDVFAAHTLGILLRRVLQEDVVFGHALLFGRYLV